MLWCFVAAGFLSVSTRAFTIAPIRWQGLPAKKFFLVPNAWSSNPSVSSRPINLAQILTVWEEAEPKSSGHVPDFTYNIDQTVTFDDLCMTASGSSTGDLVGVDRCAGAPTQQWIFTPQARGQKRQIQLKHTSKCIDVNMKGGQDGGLNGAQVELQECGSQVSQMWNFEDPISVPTRNRPQHSELAASLRHVPLYFTLIALFSGFSIGAWLRWRHPNARIATMNQSTALLTASQGGVSLCAPNAMHQDIMPFVRNDVSETISAVMALCPFFIEDQAFSDDEIPSSQTVCNDENEKEMLQEFSSSLSVEMQPQRMEPSLASTMNTYMATTLAPRPTILRSPTATTPKPLPQHRLQGGGGGGDDGGDGGGEGGGGDGGGNNRDQFIRALNRSEQKLLIDEWRGRSGVYRMTGDLGGDVALGRFHDKQYEFLDQLDKCGPQGRWVFALFKQAPELALRSLENGDDAGKIRGILRGQFFDNGSFECENIVLNPSAVNNATDRKNAVINTVIGFQHVLDSIGAKVEYSDSANIVRQMPLRKSDLEGN